MGNRELDEEETSESILDVFKSIFAQSTEVVHSVRIIPLYSPPWSIVFWLCTENFGINISFCHIS